MNNLCKMLTTVAVLTLASGCGESLKERNADVVRDAKIAALETKLAQSEERLETVRSVALDMTNHLATQTKRLSEMMDLIQTQNDNVDTIEKLVDEMFNRLTNKPAVKQQASYVSQPPSTPAIINGMPRAVYYEIKQKAEKEWPTDYRMQEYVMKRETEAYRRLHP